MRNVPDAYTVKQQRLRGMTFVANSFATKREAVTYARKIYGRGIYDTYVVHNATGNVVWYRADKCD